MTTLEAVTPVIYRWPGGEVRLQPGERVNLPEDRARRLMQKTGSRVREVIKPGTSVRFTSPVFGPCTARVLVHDGETVLVADHGSRGWLRLNKRHPAHTWAWGQTKGGREVSET